MKEIKKTKPGYISDLEEKIIELSLKLKVSENELATYQKEELALFKNFTHNLKNPLGAVNSFSNMILESGGNNFSEKQQKYLKVIQDSSKFSLNLLNTFTEYITIKKSKEILNESRVNLVQIILEEVEVLKTKISARNILIKISEPKEDFFLKLNEKYFRRIIKELVYNAIRFSEEESKVLIELMSDSKNIEIRVKDHGIGISNNNLAKIYNEFFICNTYDLVKVKCIGLGLSITKILVECLKGELKIKSILNEGTTVLVSFGKK